MESAATAPAADPANSATTPARQGLVDTSAVRRSRATRPAPARAPAKGLATAPRQPVPCLVQRYPVGPRAATARRTFKPTQPRATGQGLARPCRPMHAAHPNAAPRPVRRVARPAASVSPGRPVSAAPAKCAARVKWCAAMRARPPARTPTTAGTVPPSAAARPRTAKADNAASAEPSPIALGTRLATLQPIPASASRRAAATGCKLPGSIRPMPWAHGKALRRWRVPPTAPTTPTDASDRALPPYPGSPTFGNACPVSVPASRTYSASSTRASSPAAPPSTATTAATLTSTRLTSMILPAQAVGMGCYRPEAIRPRLPSLWRSSAVVLPARVS